MSGAPRPLEPENRCIDSHTLDYICESANRSALAPIQPFRLELDLNASRLHPRNQITLYDTES
jgi:hypothetical protein